MVMHRGGAANPVVLAMSTSYMLMALVGLLILTYVVIRLWLTRGRRLARGECWDGGLRRLLPEMTYTATGFSNPVRVIFDAIFRPTTVEDTRETVAEHFRDAIRRERLTAHIADRLALQPAKCAAMRLARAREGPMHDVRDEGAPRRLRRRVGHVDRAQTEYRRASCIRPGVAGAWDLHVCGTCRGDDSEMRCRFHLVAEVAAGSAGLVDSQRRVVENLRRHLYVYERSLVVGYHGTDKPEDRAALIGSIGWLSGLAAAARAVRRRAGLGGGESYAG